MEPSVWKRNGTERREMETWKRGWLTDDEQFMQRAQEKEKNKQEEERRKEEVDVPVEERGETDVENEEEGLGWYVLLDTDASEENDERLVPSIEERAS